MNKCRGPHVFEEDAGIRHVCPARFLAVKAVADDVVDGLRVRVEFVTDFPAEASAGLWLRHE